MKRVLYIAISIIGALLLSSSACEEIINPQDDGLLIDKTLSPSTTETILSHGNDIQIIIPGGALSEDATFKVEKNTKPPAMTIDNIQLGNNVYKIKMSGQAAFNTPILIVINYSQNMLDENNLTQDDVRGLIYANGAWAVANYTIDPTNKKIIFSIGSLTGKIKINEDIPLDNGVVTIGDGLDHGQYDNLLKSMKKIYFASEFNDGRGQTFSNTAYKDGTLEILKDIEWNGNNFSLDIDTDPGNPHSLNQLMGDHYIFKFSAEAPSNGNQKLISFDVSEIVKWSWLSGAWLDSAHAYMSFDDIPLTFVSEDKDSLIYEIVDANNSSKVLSYYLLVGGIDFLDMSQYDITYTKSELNKVRMIFTK
jgi:hypothetical protein